MRGFGGGRGSLSAALLLALSAAILCGCSRPGGNSGRASSVRGVAARPVRDDAAAHEAFRLVNEERRVRGLPGLVRDSGLDTVATRHARDQLRMNRLSHTGSDGGRLEDRLSGLDWIWAGENLARNKGFGSPPREAVRGWIASPRHYENMFRPDFTSAGMASLFDPASGFTYFVQVFMIPTE